MSRRLIQTSTNDYKTEVNVMSFWQQVGKLIGLYR